MRLACDVWEMKKRVNPPIHPWSRVTLGIRLTETDRFGSSVTYEIRLVEK
jgi:hypothetical protein